MGLTMKLAFEHASEEAKKKYLEEHPRANPKLHSVKENEGSQESSETKTVKQQIGNLAKKTQNAITSLPEKTQKAFSDKKYRQELKGDLIGFMRKEKDRFIEKGMKSVTGQFTETAGGVKALLNGEKPTVKQVESMVRMGIKLSVAGTAAMTGGASAGGMALANSMVFGSVAKFFNGYGASSAKENVLEGLKETVPVISEMNSKYTSAKTWFGRVKSVVSNFGGQELIDALTVVASQTKNSKDDEEAVKEFMGMFVQMITEIMEQTELTDKELVEFFEDSLGEDKPSKKAVAERYFAKRVASRYLGNGSIKKA